MIEPNISASAQSGSVIDTRGLSKSFNGVQALKELSLTVQKNSIFGFLGPNGAGKTTTIKLLLGLIQPTAGGGSVFDLDIGRDSVEIRSRVGYLPQEPRFYEDLTARQTLRFTAGFFFKGPKNAIDDRVQEMLELVDLQDKADRPIKGFSGGELQRLGIAQAEVNYPDLLILDEPAASLDPMGRHDILELMERLRKYTTIFYSTHILNDVQRVSDTVAILNRGEMVSCGPIEALLAGSEGPAYTLTVAGAPAGLLEQVRSQPWVRGVDATSGSQAGDAAAWIVEVSDSRAAEEQLLRLVLAEPGTRVLDFRRRVYELEDVFMQIVEGNHGG
jgi:ABC-2 type transport system ATP-binding protein